MHLTSPLPSAPRSLAERLKWLRKQRGLTQVELAADLGCEQAVVSSWEVGRTKPSAASMMAVAKYFKISLRALETGEAFEHETRHSPVDAPVATDPIQADAPFGLPTSPAGALMVVDPLDHRTEAMDAADGLALLLKALGKGRRAWIVLD